MQKILTLGSAVLAATALAVALFAGKEASPPPAAAQPSAQSQAEFRALERRVELVEESNSLLERKVFELSHLKLMLADGGVAIAATELPSMNQTASGRPGAGSAVVPAGAISKEELKDAALAAQRELAAEQHEKVLQRFEKEQEKLQAVQAERWKRFTTEANLNPAQEQALQANLDAEGAKRKALMDEVRAGNKSYFEIRGDMRETRQATDQAMGKVLTPDQLTKYTDVRRDERRDGRGAGGPGGGSPGGPQAQ